MFNYTILCSEKLIHFKMLEIIFYHYCQTRKNFSPITRSYYVAEYQCRFVARFNAYGHKCFSTLQTNFRKTIYTKHSVAPCPFGCRWRMKNLWREHGAFCYIASSILAQHDSFSLSLIFSVILFSKHRKNC